MNNIKIYAWYGIFFITALCCAFGTLSAQNLSAYIATSSGYEHNIFNTGTRDLASLRDGESLPIIRNGFFQRGDIGVRWKRTIDRHQIRVNIKNRYDYFPSVPSATLWRPEFITDYTFKKSKQTQITLSARMLWNNTNPVIDDSELITVPNAYTAWRLQHGIKHRWNKNYRTRASVFFRQKNYTPFNNRSLSYTAYGIKIKTTRAFRSAHKTTHNLSLEIQYRHRNYTIINNIYEEFSDDDETVFERQRRIWTYLSASPAYEHTFYEGLKWKLGGAIEQRKDKLDENAGYLEWAPFSEFRLDTDRLYIAWKVALAVRRYADIAAYASSVERLQHVYLRNRLDLRYHCSSELDVRLNVYIRYRWRNESMQARTFLPYTHYVSSIGLRYTF